MLERSVPDHHGAGQVSAEPPQAPLGDRLKTFFDRAVSAPVPDRLAQLLHELDCAYDRGDLCAHKGRTRP